MSKGLGCVEKAILQLADAACPKLLQTNEFARSLPKTGVAGYNSKNCKHKSAINSASRALRSLHAKGLIFRSLRLSKGYVYWGTERAFLRLIYNGFPIYLDNLHINPALSSYFKDMNNVTEDELSAAIDRLEFKALDKTIRLHRIRKELEKKGLE